MADSVSPRERPDVAEFTIAGYKSVFEPQSVSLRPLTLIAGANSSGKSSLMQPLLLLKQTMDAQYDPGTLLLDGPNVHLTSVDQLLSKRPGHRPASQFTVTFRGNGSEVGLIFDSPKRGIEVKANILRVGEKSIEVRSDTSSDALREWVVESNIISLPDEIFKSYKLRPVRVRFLFTFALTAADKAQELPHPFRLPIVGSVLPVEDFVSGCIHVPGLRGNPERTYKTTSVGPRFPGTFENYVASVIDSWQETKAPELKTLGHHLEQLGLTWKVRSKRLDDTQVELLVARLPHAKRGGADDVVSIADVGFGVSQTLPVLVALLVAKRGQVVYIEQPEIHLHPRAQQGLADVLAEAANRGVMVIVETHSSQLLLSLQTLVAEGKLPSSSVKLHWVERTDTGATKVTATDVDGTGAFGEWPIDFSEVILAGENRFLEAAEARLTGK